MPCDDGMSPASSLGGLCASPVSGNSIIYGNRTGRTQQPWNDARKPDPSWALLVLTTRSAPGETDDPQDLRCEAHEAHHCPSFFLSPPPAPCPPTPFPIVCSSYCPIPPRDCVAEPNNEEPGSDRGGSETRNNRCESSHFLSISAVIFYVVLKY